MAVTITYCEATPSSITVVFSEAVDINNSAQFVVFDPTQTILPLSPTSVTPALPTAGALSFQLSNLQNQQQQGVNVQPYTLGKGDKILLSVTGAVEHASKQTIPNLTIGAEVKSDLRIVDCVATPSLVVVYFSEDLDRKNWDSFQGNDPDYTANYSVQAGYGSPLKPTKAKYDYNAKATFLEFDGTIFDEGEDLAVTVSNVSAAGGPKIGNSGNNTFRTRVRSDRRDPGQNGGRGGGPIKNVTESVEDAVAYPLLTEAVSFPPTSGNGPIYTPTRSAGGGAALGQSAIQALTDVLGWKANSSDPKGFIGALTQAFTLTEVQGHVEATWNPRTYAVQTDLGGGITGAQASLYTRAKDALDQSLPLLDGLYPLDPDADPEYVKALRDMAKSQMNAIVSELGTVGGPSILRVNTYFQILLNAPDPITFAPHPTVPQFDPDQIGGTLGQLRDTYGIYFQKKGQNNPFSNSIEDEQNITNFRVISDYMTSLLQSWISNGQFFELGSTTQPAFFGTQLVLISRQFSVISETVNELRFALDSVFIGPSERQTLLLQFQNLPAIFLEDMLQEIDAFVSQEGPGLLQNGGRISVTNNILPVIRSFENMVREAKRPKNPRGLPDGYRTTRVQRAIDDLLDQLKVLIGLVKPVSQQVPPPIEQPGLPILAPIPPFLQMGASNAVQTVTLMNVGSVPLTVVSAILGGPNPQSFTLGPTSFPAALVPQAATAVSVTFPAGLPGARALPQTWNATLTVNYQVTGPDGRPRLQTLPPINITGTLQ